MEKSLAYVVHPERVRLLQNGAVRKGPVLYWMSREQRVNDNWALIFAQCLALQQKKELLVVFCLTTDFLGANLRHFAFLLKGLLEILMACERLNIAFHLLEGNPSTRIPEFVAEKNAGILVADFDPLRVKKEWKISVGQSITIPFYEVDAHNIVPVWHASPKKEFAAHTLRPKIHRLLPEFLTEFPELIKHPFGITEEKTLIDMQRIKGTIKDHSVTEISWCESGSKSGLDAVRSFIRHGLAAYPEKRNNPCENGQSNLSPYLHFGHIAPQRVALEVTAADVSNEAKSQFLEELIVRRELADNFCFYEPAYDSGDGFHDWAKKTLNEHRHDTRQYLYSPEQFDNAATHDDLWSACQKDLVSYGKLHGYLRMYWAKKILEWTASPEEAIQTAIHLNDRYSIDGRDPNGYTGIAWSIGGVHDRAWAEREIFGKVRYMSYQGCRRKFDVPGYIRRVNDCVCVFDIPSGSRIVSDSMSNMPAL